MRKRYMFSMPLFALIALGAGCTSPAEQSSKPRVTTESPKPAPAARPKPATFTAANNPTAIAGRGEPSLDDRERPAAWVYIDGKAGKFTARDGEPLTQWVIEGPVSSAPTFRVEGYEPLLGAPKDFRCVLQAVDSSAGSTVVYGIAANEGAFAVGQDYPLLNPGDNFVIRNGLTGDIVKEIAPLAPGTYALVGGLENRTTSKRALAVSYFTVGDEK